MHDLTMCVGTLVVTGIVLLVEHKALCFVDYLKLCKYTTYMFKQRMCDKLICLLLDIRNVTRKGIPRGK